MAKASFKLSIYQNNVVLLSFTGSLDAMIINKAINECIDKDLVNVAVNLDQVLYTNSSFLATFIGLNTTIEKKSGRIVFIQPPKDILIVMTLMGFKEYFEFYSTKNNALGSLINQ